MGGGGAWRIVDRLIKEVVRGRLMLAGVGAGGIGWR